jgi:peroxiredoxin
VCNREAASVEAAAQRWAGKVNFVGVAWTGSQDEFQGFIDRYALSFPQISDDPGDVFARFGVAGQPAMAIVLPDGEVQTIMGAADDDLLDSILSDAIG